MKVEYSSKNVLKNSSLSFVYKVISMLLSLVSAPLILNILGEEKYGVWTSLLSIVSWIYYMDLGIGNGLRIRLSEALARNEQKKAEKYITVSYVMLSIISLVAFLSVFIFTRIFDIGKLLNIDNVTSENINTIFLVAILFVCINFVFSLVNNIFYALQNASAVSALGIIGQFLNIVGLFLYQLTGSSLILAVSCIDGVSQLLKNIIGSVWAYVKYPECRIAFEKPDYKYSDGILSFGIQTFVINISALILNSTDNIIIVRYIGATDVTAYSFCYKYFSIISSIFAVLVIPLQSAYTMAYTRKDYKWITKNLRRAILLWCVFAAGTVLAIFFIKPFLRIWLQRELNVQWSLILYMALYTVLLMVGHTFSTFLGGVGRIKEMTFVGIIQAILNVPVSIILAVNYNMGVNGVILGSVVAIALSAIVEPIVTLGVMRNLRKEVNENQDRK